MMRWMRSALRTSAVIALMTPAVAHADVIIGPRVAYYFDNSNLRTSSIAGGVQDESVLFDQDRVETLEEFFPDEFFTNAQQDGIGVLADQIAVPMVGAMVNFGDDRDRITLSGLYGEGSGSFSQVQAVSTFVGFRDRTAVDFGRLTNDIEYDYERIDLEATWQRRTSESFAFLVGLRYERLNREGTGFNAVGITQNGPNLINAILDEALGNPPSEPISDTPGAFAGLSETSTQETYSARAGVTAFVPVSESVTAFFNGMVHASYQPEITSDTQFDGLDFLITEVSEGEFSAGPDFAVGAQFIVSDKIALDVRYRANIFFPLSGAQSFSDARVNHGVNLGLSVRL